MKQLKIKDNSRKKKSDFLAVSETVSMIADKTLEQLEKDGVFVFPPLVRDMQDLSKEQMVLQSFNDTYRCGNVMGFLGYKDERLIISSRFSAGEDDYFLNYLLEKVVSLPNVTDMNVDASRDSMIMGLFTFIFPYYLKKAARKGLFKTYISRNYNDSNPKGKIDINRHIKVNIPFTGKVTYNIREYSRDNFLIRLIRHTIEFIKNKPYGKKILFSIKDEVRQVIEATRDYQSDDRQKIIFENLKKPVRHAYFHEYRALQYLCILILQNRKHQLGSGTGKVYGILFDGAWLWEEYVYILINDMFYHPMNKKGKDAQWLFADKKGMIYPDFIGKNKDFRLIADAKYKPVFNISNNDYFQLLAYMIRFGAQTGIYFYPESYNKDPVFLWLNSGLSYEGNEEKRDDIKLIKLGLKIPLCDNYNDFKKQMSASEKIFRQELEVILPGR